MEYSKNDLILALAALIDGQCEPGEIRDTTGWSEGQSRWLSQVAKAWKDTRYERIIDDTTYVVVRGDLYPWGRKFLLRRKDVPGPPDGYTFIKEDAEDAMAQAVRRLLGTD